MITYIINKFIIERIHKINGGVYHGMSVCGGRCSPVVGRTKNGDERNAARHPCFLFIYIYKTNPLHLPFCLHDQSVPCKQSRQWRRRCPDHSAPLSVFVSLNFFNLFIFTNQYNKKYNICRYYRQENYKLLLNIQRSQESRMQLHIFNPFGKSIGSVQCAHCFVIKVVINAPCTWFCCDKLTQVLAIVIF